MKRRRSIILTLLILLLAVVGLGTTGYILVRRQPAFYAQANKEDINDGELSAEVFTRYGDLRNDVLYSPEWTSVFEANKVNAFLREHFAKGGSLENTFGKDITNPRVWVEGDRLIVAATYQASPVESWASEQTSTVLSAELKMWVVAKEPCTVAIEVYAVKAGAIPIGSQRYLDKLAEAARDSNIEVTWYRKDGHPVGLFRFYANLARPTRFIQNVTIGDGKLMLSGKNIVEGVTPTPPRP